MTAQELRDKFPNQDIEQSIKKIDKFLVKQAKNNKREALVKLLPEHENEIIKHYIRNGFEVSDTILGDHYRIKW